MNNTKAKISQNKQKKIAIADELTAKVEKATGMVFTNYTGLTHQQIEGLKRSVKKLDGEFVITKNTLLKRALTNDPRLRTEDLKDEVFHNPTATLFAYNDIVEPLKVLTKSIQNISLPLIKAGFMEGHVLSDKQVDQLSTLPAKPVLQAQLLGMMKQPIQGLHRALSWNMQSLVMTLNAITQKKS